MSTSFEDQLKSLQQSIANKERCVPTLAIVGLIAPLIVFLALYFLQPSFVQSKDGDEYVRSTSKVFYWTLGLTVLLWISLYLFSWCGGYNKLSQVCFSK